MQKLSSMASVQLGCNKACPRCAAPASRALQPAAPMGCPRILLRAPCCCPAGSIALPPTLPHPPPSPPEPLVHLDHEIMKVCALQLQGGSRARQLAAVGEWDDGGRVENAGSRPSRHSALLCLRRREGFEALEPRRAATSIPQLVGRRQPALSVSSVGSAGSAPGGSHPCAQNDFGQHKPGSRAGA